MLPFIFILRGFLLCNIAACHCPNLRNNCSETETRGRRSAGVLSSFSSLQYFHVHVFQQLRLRKDTGINEESHQGHIRESKRIKIYWRRRPPFMSSHKPHSALSEQVLRETKHLAGAVLGREKSVLMSCRGHCCCLCSGCHKVLKSFWLLEVFWRNTKRASSA